MSNETPAEVLADFKALIESDEPRGAGSYLIKLARILGRLERSLAAGKAQHVALLDKRGDEILCHDVPKFSRELADGNYRLYTAPPADPAKAGGPEDVRIDFPGIGYAGPFPVVNGEITLPAETMSDLAHHFRMGYVAKASGSEPEYDRSLIADMLESANGLRNEMYSHDAMIDQVRLLRAADNADAAKVRTVRSSGSAPDGMIALVEALDAAMVESLLGEGADIWKGNRGKLRNRLPENVGAILAKMRALLATPPASAPEVTDRIVTAASELLRLKKLRERIDIDPERPDFPANFRELDDEYRAAKPKAWRELEDALNARVASPAMEGEVSRFCPGCGSVGDVPPEFRDCCPDGSEARVIPKALALKCQSLFKTALTAALQQEGKSHG